MKNIPNAISLIRLIFSPYVFVLASKGEVKESAMLFLTLALSDAVDGAIARIFNAKSTLGKLLDPIADKALLLFGLMSITFYTEVRSSLLLFSLLLLRDTLLVGGSVVLKRLNFMPEPSILGKLTTFFVSVTVFVGFLVNLRQDSILLLIFDWSQAVSLALVVVSGIDYTARGVNFLLSKLIMERR